MWRRLPLRVRLFLPTTALIAASLLFGLFALQIFSPEQFENENEEGKILAQTITNGLNAALAVTANPQQALDAFAGSIGTRDTEGIGTGDTIHFRKVEASTDIPTIRLNAGNAPEWFIGLLRIPNIASVHPVFIANRRVGDIIFSPDLSADLLEKWLGFLAIVLSGSLLLILAALSAYLTAALALRPLEQLGAGLARLQQGNYDSAIPLLGPPEIRKSCEEANQLARKLKRLAQDNRDLLRKIVSLQDNERRELANDLHDELGPLLFAIKANAIALSESAADTAAIEPDTPAHRLLEATEAVQHASRRVIEGLSPLYLEELGLKESIRTLLQNAHSALPALATAHEIDSRLDALDGLLSQTIYRVTQEAVTNVIRHAQATRLNVVATLSDQIIVVEISDDGVGFPDNVRFGRGLTAMSDRIHALGGTLELIRDGGKTIVRCSLQLSWL